LGVIVAAGAPGAGGSIRGGCPGPSEDRAGAIGSGMGLLDDISRGANKIANQISTGVDDTQARFRLEHLLQDYGLLLFRQQTGQPLPDSDAEVQRVWREVHELLARYPNLTPQLRTSAAPPPPPPSGQPPGGPPPPSGQPGGGPPPPPPSSGSPPPAPPAYGPP